MRFDQIRALVHDHTLVINKYCFNSPDLVGDPRGTSAIYPNKAPGMTFIGVIPFALLSCVVGWLKAGGLPEWIYWHLLTYLTTVFTVSLMSALAAIAIYRVLKKLTGDSYFSAVVVIAILLGTLLFPFSTLFYSHVPAASLLAIAFYLLFEIRRSDPAIAGRPLVYGCLSGALIGLSVAIEYPAVLLAAVLSIYALSIAWQHKGSTKDKAILFGTFLLGLAIAGTILIQYNVIAFGNIFYVPYEAYSRPGTAFHSTYAHGWMGLHWSGLPHFMRAIASVTIYPPSGLLYIVIGRWHIYACNPVLWLALPGFVIMLWRRNLRAEGLVVAGMVMAYLLFISSYGSSLYDWGGGLYLGPRHLIPLLPFLALPVYFGAQKLRVLFYSLAAISVFYMLLGTAVEPRVAFPFGDINHDFLLPDYFTGHFAQNTTSLFDPAHRNLTSDSTAANLAKLTHVPGPYQLAPLMGWWALIGATLQQMRKRLWSIGTVVLFLFVGAIAAAPVIHHAMIAPRANMHGLLGKYYRNATWAGAPDDVKIDPAIDFDWPTTTPYTPPLSVEWTGEIFIEREGFYLFTLAADDGALLEIDRKLIVDASHSPRVEISQTTVLARGRHSIRVRYFNLLFGGSVKLWWTLIGRPRQIVPNEVLIPEMARLPSK